MSSHPATLWAIVGATGTGKSDLSLDLAERLDGLNPGKTTQIVNADAMQFYRAMDIGTAKLSMPERRGIPHHLFEALEVTEEATVAWYQPTARRIIKEYLDAGHNVIIVGGSGLYVSSVIYDFNFPPRDEAARARIEASFEAEGIDPLMERLRAIAPEVAATVDSRNPRRVIRALELAEQGETAQTNLPTKPTLWWPQTRIIGVGVLRETLVERLNTRVERMWETGLLEEVRGLIPRGLETGPTASRAIGYQQAISHLRGEMTQQESIELTKTLTRRYARRQVSWFKRYPEIEWVDGLTAKAEDILI